MKNNFFTNTKKWKTKKYKYTNIKKNTQKNIKKNKNQIGGFVYGKTRKTLSIKKTTKTIHKKINTVNI